MLNVKTSVDFANKQFLKLVDLKFTLTIFFDLAEIYEIFDNIPAFTSL